MFSVSFWKTYRVLIYNSRARIAGYLGILPPPPPIFPSDPTSSSSTPAPHTRTFMHRPTIQNSGQVQLEQFEHCLPYNIDIKTFLVWNGISRLVYYNNIILLNYILTIDGCTLFPDSTFRSGADGSEFEANQMEVLYQSRKNDPPRTSLHFPIPEDDLEVLHYLTSSARRPRSATGTGPHGYQFRERAFSISLGKHRAENFEGQDCSEPNLLEMVPPISQFPGARLCAGSTVHSATLPLGFQAPSYFESRERGVWPDGSRMMKFQKEQQSCPCSSCSDVANYQFPVKTVRSGSIGNANTSYYNARRMWAEDDETTSESFYRKFDSPKFDSFRPKKESAGAGCVYSNVHATAVFENSDRDDPGHSSAAATLYDCPVSSSLKTGSAEAENPPIENNIQKTIAADVASGGESGNDVIPIDTVIPVREIPSYKNVGKNCPCCGNVLKTSPAAKVESSGNVLKTSPAATVESSPYKTARSYALDSDGDGQIIEVKPPVIQCHDSSTVSTGIPLHAVIGEESNNEGVIPQGTASMLMLEIPTQVDLLNMTPPPRCHFMTDHSYINIDQISSRDGGTDSTFGLDHPLYQKRTDPGYAVMASKFNPKQAVKHSDIYLHPKPQQPSANFPYVWLYTKVSSPLQGPVTRLPTLTENIVNPSSKLTCPHLPGWFHLKLRI